MKIDFKYCIYYTFNYGYDCSAQYWNTYACDDICRCGKIEGFNMENCDIPCVLNTLSRGIKNKIHLYCLERFLNRLINGNSLDAVFEADIRKDYYGEELDGIYMCDDAELGTNKFLEFMKTASDADLIERVIKDEYGHILPQIKNKTWNVNMVPVKDINMTLNDRLDIEKISAYEDYKELSCLCIKNGNSYQLIDGRHRYVAAVNNKKKKILTVWC